MIDMENSFIKKFHNCRTQKVMTSQTLQLCQPCVFQMENINRGSTGFFVHNFQRGVQSSFGISKATVELNSYFPSRTLTQHILFLNLHKNIISYQNKQVETTGCHYSQISSAGAQNSTCCTSKQDPIGTPSELAILLVEIFFTQNLNGGRMSQ